MSECKVLTDIWIIYFEQTSIIKGVKPKEKIATALKTEMIHCRIFNAKTLKTS